MNMTEDFIIDAVKDILDDGNIWTPEFLARKFWEMDSKKQADFFNFLSNASKFDQYKQPAWSDMQWRYMQSFLTPQGKELIDNIKIHTD